MPKWICIYESFVTCQDSFPVHLRLYKFIQNIKFLYVLLFPWIHFCKGFVKEKKKNYAIKWKAIDENTERCRICILRKVSKEESIMAVL